MLDSILKGIISELKQDILSSRAGGWPPESVLSFLRGLPPQTVGTKFGCELVRRLLERENVSCWRAGTRLYDIVISARKGEDGTRVEVKCSTELPQRRFQQVRDPRPEEAGGRWRYDCLVCVGVSPDNLTFWFVPGEEVARLIDDGLITVQHADSETNWFFPNEDYDRCPFKPYVVDRSALVRAIVNQPALGAVRQ